MISEKEVLKKGLKILEKEFSAEEYIAFLRAVTPKFEKDSTALLKELSKGLTIDEIFEKMQKWERARIKVERLYGQGLRSTHGCYPRSEFPKFMK